MSDQLEFLPEDDEIAALEPAEGWPVLIVDDEPAVHQVTSLALAGVTYKDRPIELINAYSGAEALLQMMVRPDIAVILLDVVMESEDAGLQCVRAIREHLANTDVRIILRTGQPGQAPERSMITDYDINAYKAKTELTSDKLYVSVIAELRTYEHIMAIERSRRELAANRAGLLKIIEASSTLFRTQSIQHFAQDLLAQLAAMVSPRPAEAAGSLAADPAGTVIAGTARYAEAVGKNLCDIADARLLAAVDQATVQQKSVVAADHFVGVVRTGGGGINALVIDGPIELAPGQDMLVEVFCRNVGIAYDNLLLRDHMDDTQREIIYRMGNLIETRSNETANHVRRMAEFSYVLALELGLGDEAASLLRAASPMHDIGKIGIPDEILNKPGRLDDREWAQMQTHVTIGWNLTKDMTEQVWKTAAIVALEHHERWDGKGYPHGMAGEQIDIMARITALADVYDALTSRRVYKAIWPLPDVLNYIREQRGQQFDPAVVDAFFARFEEIEQIRHLYADRA